LLANKLGNLERGGPELILSANIGCLTHLENGTRIPVRHWIEWVDLRVSFSRGQTPTSPPGGASRDKR
jgi:glycolate oxidase iron-sulfur subunit